MTSITTITTNYDEIKKLFSECESNKEELVTMMNQSKSKLSILERMTPNPIVDDLVRFETYRIKYISIWEKFSETPNDIYMTIHKYESSGTATIIYDNSKCMTIYKDMTLYDMIISPLSFIDKAISGTLEKIPIERYLSHKLKGNEKWHTESQLRIFKDLYGIETGETFKLKEEIEADRQELKKIKAKLAEADKRLKVLDMIENGECA